MKKKEIIVIFLVVGLFLFFLSIPFLMLIGVWDYFIYNKSVSTKEDVFEMVLENQMEFEKIVADMKVLLEDSNEDIIILDGREEYREQGIKSLLFKQYPISAVSVKNCDLVYEVSIHLQFCPKGYTYWGVYYTDDDEPSTWGVGTLEECDGIYTQEGSYFKYETQRIVEHWYYYQCWTR